MLPLLAEISIADSNMGIRRRPKTPAWVDGINVPQIVMRPELKIVSPKIIAVHRTNVLILVRLVPMHGMLMFTKV
jgi:hypothetical protein